MFAVGVGYIVRVFQGADRNAAVTAFLLAYAVVESRGVSRAVW